MRKFVKCCNATERKHLLLFLLHSLHPNEQLAPSNNEGVSSSFGSIGELNLVDQLSDLLARSGSGALLPETCIDPQQALLVGSARVILLVAVSTVGTNSRLSRSPLLGG